MELDSKGLGRLSRVANARDVWISEAGDFTPWLAENLDVLADELGMTLTLIGTEVIVGDFRLDIQAEADDGRIVIVENQLERTDHGHLGQLLVYASGLEATAVVWVAPRFRDDHRRAFDWLNERTDSGVDFFGVEVGVVQIGESGPRAPIFEVVARPNWWQKGVKQSGAALAGQADGANDERQRFFRDVLSAVGESRPAIRMPHIGRQNWINFAGGRWGRWGFAFGQRSTLRVEAYIDSGSADLNKRLFDEIHSEAADWEETLGQLSWERLDDRKACRIASYQPVSDLEDSDERERLIVWAARTLVAMYDRMDGVLRSRAERLRTSTIE
ncbi:DUF4268 domain-containing protein [Nakamurella flava]|uniref:DUF4268 domain-containing protein n=1 Tax=Nakamurella flava TaxID=2576308 RepID=A0A4U6QAU9_9ACTN|nr:DUF4268 domain-containing protein [Nakamurella flava]TKV57080.1 DUF4268 domain-containing protein [Nakamurella flava]